MTMTDYVVFILTHGRPDNVKTLKALNKCGYTGKVYLVVDDEDKTLPQYKAKYGDMVLVFSKSAVAETFDEMGLFTDRRAVVYARNACFALAEQLGVEYFIQLDDDYQGFYYRFSSELVAINSSKSSAIRNLDAVFSALFDFFKVSGAYSIAMAQTGDFIGGTASTYCRVVGTKRKVMNSFFCSTNRPFKFIGRVNEDVNTYTTLGTRGVLFLQINQVYLQQTTTQANEGGMSGLYLDSGTYIKSFYTVVTTPACATVRSMGQAHPRLHHHINWTRTTPKIIADKHKRPKD